MMLGVRGHRWGGWSVRVGSRGAGQGDGERSIEVDVVAGGIDGAGRQDAGEGGERGRGVVLVGVEDGTGGPSEP